MRRVIVVGWMLASAASAERTCYYEPRRTLLHGRLVVRQYYGRPSYGERPETDERENAYLLVLKEAIKVIPDKRTEVVAPLAEGVEEIQLVFDPLRLPLESFLGREIEVEGILYPSFAAHHHARVLLSVTRIGRAYFVK